MLLPLGDVVLNGVFGEVENGPVPEGALDMAQVAPDLFERLDALEFKLREERIEERLHRSLPHLRVGDDGLADALRAEQIPLGP
jgi:hypothetical protein